MRSVLARGRVEDRLDQDAWNVTGYPRIVLIDAEGNVVSANADRDDVRKLLNPVREK